MIRTSGRVALKWYEHDSVKPKGKKEPEPVIKRWELATQGRPWKKWEDQYLEENWTSCRDSKACGEYLGRTEGAVTGRAYAVGLAGKS